MVHIRRDFEDLADLADLKRNLQSSGLFVVGQALDFLIDNGNVAGLKRKNAVGAVLDFLLADATKDHGRHDTVQMFGNTIASLFA